MAASATRSSPKPPTLPAILKSVDWVKQDDIHLAGALKSARLHHESFLCSICCGKPGMDRDQSLKVAILQFLVDHGHLNKIQSQCGLYLSNKKAQEQPLTPDAEKDAVIQTLVTLLPYSLCHIQDTAASTVYKIALLIDTFELIQFNGQLVNSFMYVIPITFSVARQPPPAPSQSRVGSVP